MFYQLELSEKELNYIRTAVCKQNMKHCIASINAEKSGNNDIANIHCELRLLGHHIINNIDNILSI